MGSPTLRIARVALYLVWTLGLMPVQGVGLALRRPWSRTPAGLLSSLVLPHPRLRVRAIGAPTVARPVLFASNHVSYPDITVLGSLIAGSFVAKAEVARLAVVRLAGEIAAHGLCRPPGAQHRCSATR